MNFFRRNKYSSKFWCGSVTALNSILVPLYAAGVMENWRVKKFEELGRRGAKINSWENLGKPNENVTIILEK